MKILFLVLLGFSIFIANDAFSGNASTFDIQGFRLGDSFSEVKRKFPCQNPEIKKERINGKIKSIYVECNYKEDGLFLFVFGHDQKILSINKVFRFKDFAPDYDHISKKIFLKYGKPKKTGKGLYYTNNQELHSTCWGDCKTINFESNRYWEGSGVDHGDIGKSLVVDLKKNNGTFKAVLSIKLLDAGAVEDENKWYARMEYQMRKKKSDIEF
ncbi:MAG: hypothetical protein D3917_11250 [Candidatus Electrothrix sp. AX5]|nr:hypothetical protein [Candidatus Electrothrix sp. AX5]